MLISNTVLFWYVLYIPINKSKEREHQELSIIISEPKMKEIEQYFMGAYFISLICKC